MTSELEKFESQFEEEIQEFVVCIRSAIGKKSIVIERGEYREAWACLKFAINEKTGEVISERSHLRWIVKKKNKIFGFKYGYKFVPEKMYRVLVRKIKPKYADEIKYFVLGTPYMVVKVLEKNVNNEKVSSIINQYEKENKLIEPKVNQKNKNTKKYKQQYISNLKINHQYFNDCVFEKDSNLEQLTLISGFKNISFGCKKKIDEVNMIISEKNIDYVFNSLEKIFRNADSILEECYPKIQKIITDWGGIDEKGNSVNIDYVRNKYKITIMEVDDDNVVFLGEIDDSRGEDVLGGHGINIYIDLKSKEIDCILE